MQSSESIKGGHQGNLLSIPNCSKTSLYGLPVSNSSLWYALAGSREGDPAGRDGADAASVAVQVTDMEHLTVDGSSMPLNKIAADQAESNSLLTIDPNALVRRQVMPKTVQQDVS